MQEIELKFLVPESRLKGLMRQAQVKSSQVLQLAAHYFDTADQQLAQAGIGLRIRREGDAWVQTIKAGGDGIAARLEHNAVLDNVQVQAMLDKHELMPDLTIYEDTPIAPALAAFNLKKLAKQLNRQYVTDVRRTTRLLVEEDSEQGNNMIEMAYDYGEIVHGNDDSRREAIQEIEFELISGDLDFLFITAKNWCKRYKLCLSTVTKAERGGLLIQGQPHSPAVSADPSQLMANKDSSMPAFVRAAVHNCLIQILPNSSAIVACSTDDTHVLQLRIGIRRLLAALKAFASFSDEINPDWPLILKQTAHLLDSYREATYLASHIEPKLQKHGAPVVDWYTDKNTIKITPIDAVRANDFQLTLLELIAFTMSDPSLEPKADKFARDKIVKVLSKQHKKLLKVMQNLDDINNAEPDRIDLGSSDLKGSDLESYDSYSNDKPRGLHKLSLQLKNSRYISEFATPLLHKKGAKKKNKRGLKRLIKAQKALDRYLDHNQYQQRYQQKATVDTNALYGTGWFAARLSDDYKRHHKRLANVKDNEMFW